MTSYTIHTDSTESEYEDEDHVISRPKRKLGQGVFAEARELHNHHKIPKKVVLSPVQVKYDASEVCAKYHFFKTLYPESKPHYFEITNNDSNKSYRLVLPFVPGSAYSQLKITNNASQHISLFLSAIDTLEQCHQKGLIVVDLHQDNIFYDEKTGKSYLIDGGHSSLKNEPLHAMFTKANEERARYRRAKHRHIAPECFSLTGTSANENMDIYSLGYLMRKTFEKHQPMAEIAVLYLACQYEAPYHRPSLNDLRSQLQALQQNVLTTPVDHKEQIPSFSLEIKKFIFPKEDEYRESLLMPAARHSSTRALSLLLNAIMPLGPETMKIVLQHHKTNIPDILFALAEDNPTMLQALFDIILTFTPNALQLLTQQRGKEGWDILMIAIRYYPIAIDPILESINSLMPYRKESIFKNKNSCGWNVLMLAIKYHPDAVILLLGFISLLKSHTQHAIFQQQTQREGMNALILAAIHHSSSVKLLLDFICKLSIDQYLKSGCNALCYALEYQSDAISPLLVFIQQLKQCNSNAVKLHLKAISFLEFQNSKQLIDFFNLLEEPERQLTRDESKHFASLLTPKDWYELALMGWLRLEIAKSKKALVYRHIMSLEPEKQQEILQMITSKTTQLGPLLKKRAGAWFDTDYLKLLIKHLRARQTAHTRLQAYGIRSTAV